MTEIPVVELIRVSTAAQAGEDRAGIPAQRATNLQTCARHHLRVVATVEVVETGATVATSAEMQHVLELVRAGRVRGIVLAAYDRLFRPDRWTDLAILQVISDQGAQIYVPAGPIDLQTEVGFITASTNNLLAGLERRRIRERTMRARESLRRGGKLATGKPPLGFAYDRAAGWSYTSQIETVREVFALYLSGVRCFATIGARVGLDQYHVQTILRRPMYAGWHVYEPRDGTGPARRYGQREWPPIRGMDDGVIRVRTGLVPVVSVEEFEEVQRLLSQGRARRSLTRQRGHGEGVFLYRGMLGCPCGEVIYGIQKGRGAGRTDRYYGCRNAKLARRARTECTNVYMGRERVEELLEGVVSERLLDAGLIAAAVEAYNASTTAAWRETALDGGGERRRRDLERRRDRIAESYIDGTIDRATRDAHLAAVAAQLAALPRPSAAPAPPPAALGAADVLDVLGVFAEWSLLAWGERRRVLEALAPLFVVHRYQVEGVRLELPGRVPAVRDSRSGRGEDTTGAALWIPLGAA